MNPPEKTVAGKNMTKSVHEMSASARQVEISRWHRRASRPECPWHS